MQLDPASGKNLRLMVEDLKRILRQLQNMDENINHPQMKITIESKLLKWIMSEMPEVKEAEREWNVHMLRS